MNERTHKTEPLTEDQLRALGAELLEMGDALMKAADAAADEPEGTLEIYNWPSALLGRKKLKTFVDDAREATQLSKIGDARKSGTPKPRSRNKSAEGLEKNKTKKGKGEHLSDVTKRTSSKD